MASEKQEHPIFLEGPSEPCRRGAGSLSWISSLWSRSPRTSSSVYAVDIVVFRERPYRSQKAIGYTPPCPSERGSRIGPRWTPPPLLSSSWSCYCYGPASAPLLDIRSSTYSTRFCRAIASWKSFSLLPPSPSLLVCSKSFKRLRHLLCPTSRASPPKTRSDGLYTSSSARIESLVLGHESTLAQAPRLEMVSLQVSGTTIRV